ncbi:uncharacterized protein BO96DRAFT_324003 [Aspergillus niger CBS 101883]|uniref:Uncharacterized protein n=3 Tax=Aspergillus niger TaxID=5061 RepID=A2QN84_ASPNC|nr:uncharacterized protein BO96DRAFT_324003 [Aspergillus niger CBS 101883]XP_059600913.1 hypothetical protein An07g04740 [Aspergillus niger]PYH62756.1 hypothetical protein BO96DRAFT_324003 [Aspergillus niger CBS 101883]RDH24039.1 hypothetical protein M747DRAFT_230405 [Aspergillus niger ATCC 13496]CAK39393.1 hypothetical protein An07g04740 [Aspergillus niger]
MYGCGVMILEGWAGCIPRRSASLRQGSLRLESVGEPERVRMATTRDSGAKQCLEYQCGSSSSVADRTGGRCRQGLAGEVQRSNRSSTRLQTWWQMMFERARPQGALAMVVADLTKRRPPSLHLSHQAGAMPDQRRGHSDIVRYAVRMLTQNILGSTGYLRERRNPARLGGSLFCPGARAHSAHALFLPSLWLNSSFRGKFDYYSQRKFALFVLIPLFSPLLCPPPFIASGLADYDTDTAGPGHLHSTLCCLVAALKGAPLWSTARANTIQATSCPPIRDASVGQAFATPAAPSKQAPILVLPKPSKPFDHPGTCPAKMTSCPPRTMTECITNLRFRFVIVCSLVLFRTLVFLLALSLSFLYRPRFPLVLPVPIFGFSDLPHEAPCHVQPRRPTLTPIGSIATLHGAPPTALPVLTAQQWYNNCGEAVDVKLIRDLTAHRTILAKPGSFQSNGAPHFRISHVLKQTENTPAGHIIHVSISISMSAYKTVPNKQTVPHSLVGITLYGDIANVDSSLPYHHVTYAHDIMTEVCPVCTWCLSRSWKPNTAIATSCQLRLWSPSSHIASHGLVRRTVISLRGSCIYFMLIWIHMRVDFPETG